MPTDDRSFPPALAAVAEVEFAYDDGAGVDYEPYSAFLSAEETTAWLRAWTGNAELNGDAFRVFGQDGTGGYTAFWLVRPGRPLADQPVVFLGSEGELDVLASGLDSFLWLLASGFGAYEKVDSPSEAVGPHPEMTAIAERFAPDCCQPAATVTNAAAQEFPDFEKTIVALCR